MWCIGIEVYFRKKAIKAKAPEEIIELIGAIRTIVAMDSKTPKKGAL